MSGWPVTNPIQAGDGDQRHGSVNGYVNHLCRCDECRGAWRAEQRRQNAQRAAKGVPDDIHGKRTTYANWQCRCAECRAAHAAAKRELYARRRTTQ